MRRPSLLYGFIFLSLALASTGCSSLNDPESSQEIHSEIIASTGEGQEFGQTFVSRRPELDGVLLWLAVEPGASPQGYLIAELGYSPYDPQPLNIQQISFSQVIKGNPVHLDLPPQDDPASQAYFLRLKSQGGGIQVFGRTEDAYPLGQAFSGGDPLPGDAAFRLTYNYGLAALKEDLGTLSHGLWLTLPLLLVLLLPGWLLLELSGINLNWDSGEKTGVALGLSLALLPVIMLWTTQLHLRWSAGPILFAGGLLSVLAAWRTGAYLARWSREGRRKPDGISLALFSLFLVSLAVRLIMVRDLAAPAWVDSVHHALITRLIAENGGFPSSYAPYLEIGTTSYHPGFHTLVFTFQSLAGLDLPSALLLLGQVLNALIVYAVYLFTVNLLRHEVAAHRLAGLFAAGIAGLFTPMPAYYTSWGRYTQLAGLLILPAAVTLLLWLKETRLSRSLSPARAGQARYLKILLLAGLACGGLFLTHYRVLAFLVALLAAIWIATGFAHLLQSAWDWMAFRFRSIRWVQRAGESLRLLPQRLLLRALRHPDFVIIPAVGGALVDPARDPFRSEDTIIQSPPIDPPEPPGQAQIANFWRDLLSRAGWVALAGGVAILFTLPWWPNLLRSLSLSSAGGGNFESPALFSGFTWTYLVAGLGRYTLILAGAGLLLGLFLRRVFSLILILWVGLLFFLANLAALRLPGSGFINSTSVEISLFLPVSVFAGAFLAQLIHAARAVLSRRWQPVLYVILGIASLFLALFGASRLVNILNPVTLLFRQADRPAMSWIQTNLPPEATVLINPFSWGYGLYAGNDGGFWITPLTGRKTLPPPVLYGFDSQAANIWNTNETIQSVIKHSGDPAGLQELLKEAGIGYVYIGGRGGILSPQKLSESGRFTVRYAQQGAWVFEVNP